MSVTAFDGQFSFRQNELATKGYDHAKKGGMTEEQYAKFKESPFMQKARAQEEYTWTMTCERDRKRKERDPEFNPKDSDFTAPKAFEYEKSVNYYKVLGVDEYASMDEVKKAYKKLSLVYHPDKTTGMSGAEQEEHAAIFIELKNAYLTLNNQATRRQYDRDRDHQSAGAEVNGFKKKGDKPSFDATAVLKKLQEMQKPPGGEQKVDLYVKLEKLFYGGPKSYKKNRRIIKDNAEYYEDKIFRIDVPRGAPENWECKMKGGDMNWATQADRMKFVLKSKPNREIERKGDNLLLLKPILLRPDAHLQPFLSTEVPSIGGRAVLLWGRNPLYSEIGAVSAELRVGIHGEGIGADGALRFSAKMGAKKTSDRSEDALVVSVRTTYTKINFFCAVHVDGTVEDLKHAIIDVLEWPENQPMKLDKDMGGRKTAAFYSDRVVLGKVQDVILDPHYRLYEVRMSIRRAREFLQLLLALCGEAKFSDGLRECNKRRGTAQHESLVRQLWAPISKLAPFCGYAPDFEGLRTAVQRALWVLRDEPDSQNLHPRFRALGFRPRDAPKPRIPRRRKLPRPEVELFLARNALGPPTWGESGENMPEPASETDSDQGEEAQETAGDDEEDLMFGGSGASVDPSVQQSARRTHGNYAAAVHPQMIKRTAKRAGITPVCELELTPMFGGGESLQLFTRPTCYLRFYSNLKQVWAVKPGYLPPQPMFAISMSCPSGAKRGGREHWKALRNSLVPLLMKAAFLMVADARSLLPKPLAMDPAFPESEYEYEDGARVMRPGEDEGELEEEEGGVSDDEQGIMVLAKQRAREAAKARRKAQRREASTAAKVKRLEKHLSGRTPRVLCLHGAASGREIFEEQAAKLLDCCRGKVELITLEGPEECTNAEATELMRGSFAGDRPATQYAEEQLDSKGWRIYKDVRKALAWLQGKLKEHAPIDGVLGFSQGANFAAMLAGQSFAGLGMPLSFVVLACPTAPGFAEQLPELFEEYVVRVPALVIRGVREAYDETMSRALEGREVNTMGQSMPSAHTAELFHTAKLRTHCEGHRLLPSDAKESNELCQTVLEFIQDWASQTPVVRVDVPRVEEEGDCDADGMFNFDNLEDLDAISGAAEEIRQERREQRRRRSAVMEVWRRDARMAAKREFFFKAAERRALEGGGPARGAPDPPSCVSAAGMDSLEQAAGVWKHRATSAFRCGDFYRAQMCYSRELDCLPEGDAERRGVAHSNLSACLAKVQHFEGALQEAKKATELRPTWGRAWGRLGAAAALAEGSDAAEARTAWFKAVEVEPSAAHVEGLASAYEGDSAGDTTHQHKEKGAEAMRVQEYGTAIAHFTVAIAALPALAKPIKSDDDHALLRAVLHSNRCAAFSKSKLWALGVVDGKKAVEYKGDYAKAYCRLGVAQLGCRLNEDAYKSFAKALYHEDAMQLAKRGREVCLGLLPHWDSQKSHWRSTKFSRDAGRPLGVTKVYAVSDVHYDQTGREDWAHSIHPTKFLDDVLIIAGNIADSFRAVERALTNLRTKFKRIFYLPGNHEMWVNKLEEKNHPDSLCKLWSIMEMCDRLDIEVFPAAICKGVYVVPMHSWYNAHFDIKDPFPDPKSEADKYVRFPIDAQQQVWRYMLALNKAHLDRKYEGTVISFSHFVPRPGLPVWREPGIMKVSGCAELDDQIRQVGSTCHIYGHTYFKYNQTHDGVTYINRPLEIVGEGSREPLVCVFNGHHLCHELTTV